MHPLMKKQNDKAYEIVRRFLKDVNFDNEDTGLIISAAHKEAAEKYCDWLQEEYARLEKELERTVVELSAKLAATGWLIRLAGREIGKQDAIEMHIDDERGKLNVGN